MKTSLFSYEKYMPMYLYKNMLLTYLAEVWLYLPSDSDRSIKRNNQRNLNLFCLDND